VVLVKTTCQSETFVLVEGHVVNFEAVELRLTLLLVLYIRTKSNSDSSGSVVDTEQGHLHRNAVATLQANS
jgi:hypothetical protein